METIIKAPLKPLIKLLKRINKKTPAVTKVEECTKEDTGVGAAIAAGSQEENGNCALFVMKVTTIEQDNNNVIPLRERKSQRPINLIRLNDNRKKTSPKRLVKNVTMPATDLENLM